MPLKMAMQNRVGQPANDFTFERITGERGSLYGLRSEYVLLFVSNPGCALCREVREQIASSPMLSEMIERGRLAVLVLYPDEELDAWRAHAGEIPPAWINARDPGCVVRDSGLYDLRAIPSLYLLDADQAGARQGLGRRGPDRGDDRPPELNSPVTRPHSLRAVCRPACAPSHARARRV